jgi:feruloyl esterase
MNRWAGIAIRIGAVWIGGAGTSVWGGPCESLASLDLKETQITVAAVVPAGTFKPTKEFFSPVPPDTYTALPAFCRVAGSISPTPDSHIAFEVWLPIDGWNRKLVAVGNGGYSGEIWFPFMARPLAAGYAAAGTDTGHAGSAVDASFALRHPQKVVDFGFRAVHELALKSKAITVAFYGSPPRRAYWSGCASGGRQGLMEAQRFPTDFDGIVAGAPANYMTRLSARYVVVSQTIRKDGGLIPPEKLPMLHRAVLDACDVIDGVKDDVIENPLRCSFDPASLKCTAGDAPNCLTAAQVASAAAMYRPLINPLTAVRLFPGVSPGSENLWATGVGAMVPQPMPLATGIFEYIVFKKKGWDWTTFDVARDMTKVEVDAGPTLDAIDPNLTAYFDRGGKLLQYHGWSDPGIPPLNSIGYYENVRAALDDPDLDRSYRLFMVPGMGHCAGGDGPNQFDALGALDLWMETGKPPDSIVATHSDADGVVDRTRPLCPYPKVAIYHGDGSTDDAANFTCALDAH